MFEQKMLFYKLFSNFKITGAIKDVSIKLWTYISASGQSIKNLIGNFWAIYVRNMHTNLQASSSIGVGGEWCDKWTSDVTHHPFTKFLLTQEG